MHYELAKVLTGFPWAIDRAPFGAMLRSAAAATDAAILARVEAYVSQTTPKVVGDIAIIECTGPISYKNSWFSMYFGGATIETMRAQFRTALADAAVRTIVFRFDTPGGSSEMIPEFAAEIMAARGSKPGGIVSIADSCICSAGYWLAAMTERIYATKSAQIGCVGTIIQRMDITAMLEKEGIKIDLITHGAYKSEGWPYVAMTDEEREYLQSYADQVGDWFDTAVAKGRNVKKSVVTESFGQGRTFVGDDAITAGLADAPGDFEKVLAKLTKGKASVRADGAAPVIEADELHQPTVAALTPDATTAEPVVEEDAAGRDAALLAAMSDW